MFQIPLFGAIDAYVAALLSLMVGGATLASGFVTLAIKWRGVRFDEWKMINSRHEARIMALEGKNEKCHEEHLETVKLYAGVNAKVATLEERIAHMGAA